MAVTTAYGRTPTFARNASPDAPEPPVLLPQDAAPAALENGANNRSARARSDQKWGLMDWLRLESVRRRQRHCQARPHGNLVQLRRSDAAGVGYSGLQSCGSITCPHCGPKIAAARRDDLTAAIIGARVLGLRVLFGTFTLRHHRGQSFEFLQDAVAGAWHAAISGRRWRHDTELHGIEGFVRIWETKWNPESGWHVHVHFLAFARAEAEPEGLMASMFDRWRRHAVASGLAAPLMAGQDLHEVDTLPEVLGQYLSKQFAESAMDAGTRSSRSLAMEMTNAAGKTRGASFTPYEILAAAASGESRAASLWAEFELGMEGRRTIAWSRGIREALALADERSDEDIAAEEAGDESEALLFIPTPTFARIVLDRGRGPLVARAIEGDSPEQLRDYCAARGWLVYVPADRPPDLEEAPR